MCRAIVTFCCDMSSDASISVMFWSCHCWFNLNPSDATYLIFPFSVAVKNAVSTICKSGVSTPFKSDVADDVKPTKRESYKVRRSSVTTFGDHSESSVGSILSSFLSTVFDVTWYCQWCLKLNNSSIWLPAYIQICPPLPAFCLASRDCRHENIEKLQIQWELPSVVAA